MRDEKVVLIDRDGVIHEDLGTYVTRWEDFRFIPGVPEAFARLKQAGFRCVIISNQAGIGDGIYPKSALDDITRRMNAAIEQAGGHVDAVYYCLHGKQAGCRCRKPEPGLLEQAQKDFSFHPSNTFFIGDKESDIQAGKKAGVRTVLVLTGYGAGDLKSLRKSEKPDFVCKDLSEAADLVIRGAS